MTRLKVSGGHLRVRGLRVAKEVYCVVRVWSTWVRGELKSSFSAMNPGPRSPIRAILPEESGQGESGIL